MATHYIGGSLIDAAHPLDVSATVNVQADEGAANIASSQVTVGNSATLIAAARATRRAIVITNLGAVDVYIGPSGVTTATGTLLLGVKGTGVALGVTGAVYGVTGSSQAVSYIEVYD